MSEAVFTQFYQRLVRRKGDPLATTFLFGSETIALRAEKALFDLAAWCGEEPMVVRSSAADEDTFPILDQGRSRCPNAFFLIRLLGFALEDRSFW